MTDLFYTPAMKLTPRLQETVVEKEYIIVDGERLARLSRRPKGIVVSRRLSNLEKEERITIYG